MKQKLLSFLVLSLIAVSSVFAQNRTVTGKVTGADDGLPLPGVSVRVKGTTIGASTGIEGTFSLNVPADAKTLTFTYVGYTTVDVAISASGRMDVKLSPDSKQLAEVVVLAYGSAKKEAIAGSVATMNAEAIEKRAVTNITSALAGIAPGVTVAAGSGQPGSSAPVRLRGFGSFAASGAPLYVVDGSVYDGDIGDINPSDIENVSLLKDATSTALYGSRGGNGVIIITTKKGKAGQPRFNVSVNQGFSERGTPEYDRVNTYEYYPVMWQAMKNSYRYAATNPLTEDAAALRATNEIQSQLMYNPFNVPNNQIVGVDGKLNPNASLLYNDFDWYAPFEQTGKRTDANLSMSGKVNNSDYYVSLGYLDDAGYVLKTDFQRFSGRINLNTEARPWLKAGLNLSGSSSEGNSANSGSASFVNPFVFARGIGPIYPVRAYDASGQPIMNPETGEQWYDYGGHPGAVNRPQGARAGRHVIYETMLNDVLSKRNNLGARTYVDVKFLKDFTFTPSFNVDIRNNTSTEYRNPLIGDGATLNGYAWNSNSNIRSYTFNQILKYNKSFGSHTISALAGHENYDYTYRVASASKTGQILQGNTQFENFVTPYTASGYQDRETLESYFSRVNYDFNEKYFLEASIRRDGSSRFHEDSRWGTFFSAGGSWSISKEPFMSKFTWIDDLRLKASYGQVGVNALSTLYAYQAFYELGWNNGAEPGMLLTTAATPDLQWEKQNTFNTGISFSLFKNRLYGDLEYFKKGSDRLIFGVPQPLSSPVTSILKNIGSMYNSGVELTLGGDVIKAKDFNWGITTNWSVLKNEITKMPVETPAITSGTKRREVGKDYYAYYLRQFKGVDPADGSSLYVPLEGTAAANIRTVNGVDYVTNPTYAKYDYTGSAIPDLAGSVNNTFRFKDVSLSFLINYQIGGEFYDSEYAGLMTPAYGGALHKDVLNSWTTPGQVTDIPRIDIGNTTNLNAASTRWLKDASYVAFRNVNLSYNLPANVLNRIKVQNARVFVTGENLGLISARKGMNPTESFDGTNGPTYLPSRTLTFGVNFTL